MSHRDGRRWCRTPELEAVGDDLEAISGSGTLDVWAVAESGAIYDYGPK